MDPEVKQFLDANPGYTTEGPDQNGTLTYRAPSGAYINVRKSDGKIAMRGFGPPSESQGQEQAPAPEAPASTPAPSPDTTLPGTGPATQQQMEALLAKIAPNGDPNRLEFNQITRKKTVTTGSGIMAHSESVTVPVVQWIDRATGQTLEADVEDDGSYTITKNARVPQNIGQAATPATAVKPTARQSRVNPNDNTRIQEFDPDANNGQGAWVDAGPNDAEVRRRADANKGTTILKPDGKGGTIAVTTYPDGRQPTVVPVAGVPSEAQNKYREVKQDPTTGKWSGLTADGKWEEIAGGPGLAPDKNTFAGEPAGAPEMPTQPGQVMAGLQTYSAWLNSQVKLWKDSGGKQGVSPDDATKLMDRRLAMAKGTADEQSGLVTAQTNLRGQDITQRGQTLTDTQGRRAAAQTAYKNVLDLLPLASKLGPGGAPALAALMAGLLPNQRDYIGSYGGFRESPEVGTPGVLDQVRQAAMTGINNAAQGGPTIFQSRPVDGAPAVTANAAAAPPDPAGHAANIMANPVFRPRPVAPAPAPALPPGPTPPLGQGQDLSTPPPVPVNPLPGQPGHDPSKPVGMTPPPTVPVATNPIDNSPVAPPPGSVASLLMSGAQGMAGAAPMPSQSQLAALLGRGSQGARQEPDVYDGFPQNMPASPWLQQMQQGAAWDSNTHGAAVAARLGIPDDIFKQAVAGLYGQAA